MRNKSLIILILIFIIAFFLRFYKLGEIPNGFYQDESAIGFNAYSIIQTGRDEYGKYLPVYFKSFGDYKLPVYIYLTVLPIMVFGLNEFSVRFMSAFFGFFSVVLWYFFFKELTKNKILALVSTALLAINPWHLHYNRATFEVSISLFLFIFGAYLLLLFARTQRLSFFILGTLAFVFDMYTYNVTRLLSPLLYLLVLWYIRKDLRNVSVMGYGITCLLSFLLLLPFLITLFTHGGISSASGTLLFSSAQVQAPLREFRSYLVELPSLFGKVFYNTLSFDLWQYVQNIFSYLSIPFFFISGSSHGNHGIGNVGLFYLFELPCMLIGIFTLLKEKVRFSKLLFFWAVLVIVIASLTREIPHATRSFFLLVPLIGFSAVGMLTIWSWVTRQKVNYRLFLASFFGIFIVYNLVYYFTSYYVRFPIYYAKQWRQQDKALALFLKDHEANYDRIIFDREAGFMYTSLLFFLPYSPEQFQNTANRYPDDSEGFSEVASFGKYEFREIDWAKDMMTPRTLLVTTKEKKPEDISVEKIFSYPKRPVVTPLKQELISYPIEEIAYVIIETK